VTQEEAERLEARFWLTFAAAMVAAVVLLFLAYLLFLVVGWSTNASWDLLWELLEAQPA